MIGPIATGIRTPQGAGGPPPDTFTPPIDAAGVTALHGWGLRKLRSVYTGAFIRLRRTSDNAESDFGGDANGHLDIDAIETWLAGSDGRVVRMYDQVGGTDMVNFGASTQPYLAIAGVASTYGTKNRPMITFRSENNSANIRQLVSTANINLQASKRFSVWLTAIEDQPEEPKAAIIFGDDSRQDVGIGVNATTNPTDDFVVGNGGASASWIDNGPLTHNVIALRSAHRTSNGGSNATFYRNNALGYVGSIGAGSGASVQHRAGYSSTESPLDFWIAEVIYCNTDQSIAQLDMWTNVNSYYGIL